MSTVLLLPLSFCLTSVSSKARQERNQFVFVCVIFEIKTSTQFVWNKLFSEISEWIYFQLWIRIFVENWSFFRVIERNSLITERNYTLWNKRPISSHIISKYFRNLSLIRTITKYFLYFLYFYEYEHSQMVSVWL